MWKWMQKRRFSLESCIRTFFFLSCLMNGSANAVETFTNGSHLIGIVVPMFVESTYLLQQIQNKQTVNISGIEYTRGVLMGKPVVVVLSGVGEVNAAIISTRLIYDFHPKVIFMVGSAGSINAKLNFGDVVIGQRVINADLGQLTNHGSQIINEDLLNTQDSCKHIPTTFAIKTELTDYLLKINFKLNSFNVKLGFIATTNLIPNFPSQTNLLSQNKVDVVEMEGVSLMQACWLFNTSCVVIRGISDSAVLERPFTNQNKLNAAINATKVLIEIIEESVF